MNVKMAVSPAARLGIVHADVPTAPALGFTHVALGPEFWASVTNVVLLGTGSESTTTCAASGPRLSI
jgi:hypothetical protein